jgi:hypothetical protein
MTDQQINDLAKYIGCECSFLDDEEDIVCGQFGVNTLKGLLDNKISNFYLQLKPLSSLTQEDFGKMNEELYGARAISDFKYWTLVTMLKEEYVMPEVIWNEADWLRNNGYYFRIGEESIREFIKLINDD